MSRHLHIGHHFFAAGNIGDDLMLAGFLAALPFEARITCCTPFDRVSHAIRFPQIEWLPYEPAVRAACVESCDAWVGLGGSPFQGDASTWFLDHLVEEVATCRRHGKPLYFLGIGLNRRRDVEHAQTRGVLAAAEHVWTRDSLSAELFAGVCGAGRVTAGADLSHLYLRQRTFGPPERGVLGLVLNFEDPAQLSPAALCELLGRRAAAGGATRWMVQEVRDLPGSEVATHAALPASSQALLDPRAPAYATARSAGELLDAWGTPEVLVTSRYHALAFGAWAGARVVAVERNDKVHGLVEQVGCVHLPAFTSADEVARAVDGAKHVSRDRMEGVASLSSRCCEAFFRAVAGN